MLTTNTDGLSQSIPSDRRNEVIHAMYDQISKASNVRQLDSITVSLPGLNDIKFTQLDDAAKNDIRRYHSIVTQIPRQTQTAPSYESIPPTLAQAIPSSNPDILQQFAQGASRIWDWSKEMLGEGIEELKNPKTWENLQSTLVTFASGLISNIASAMKTGWDEISSTLSDPSKRQQFFKDLISGKIVVDIANTGINLLSQAFKLIKDALIKFCEISGLSDLGKAVGCLFSGDFEGAGNLLKKAGSKFSKLIGLTDLVEGISLLGQAIAKNDKDLYKKSLSHLVEGGFRIATTVFVVGKITAVFQAGRAMITSFMYRDVAADAIQVAYKSIGKTAAIEVEKQVTSTQLRQLGLQAGKNLGAATENILSTEIKSVVGRDVLGKQALKLTAEESTRVTAHLLDPAISKNIVSTVSTTAEKIGFQTTEKAIELAAKNYTSSGFEAIKKITKLDKQAVARFSEHCKTLGLKEIKKLTDDQIIALIKSEIPDLSPERLARISRAVQHISANNWRYSGAAKKMAIEFHANGMAKELMDGSLGQGMKEGWNISLDTLKARLKAANVNIDDLKPLLDDIAKAGEEGLEAGCKRACLKFSKRLFDTKKKRFDTDSKSKKKEHKKSKDENKLLESEYRNNDFENAFEDTLDALQYGKMEDVREQWTYEKQIAENEKRKQLNRNVKKPEPNFGSKFNLDDKNTNRDALETTKV